MNDLINRVRSVLAELELLSEGKTTAIDPNKVMAGGEGQGLDARLRKDGRVAGDRPDFVYHVERLEQWCKKAEDTARTLKRRESLTMTATQRDYWLIQEYEGVEYRVAAEKAGVSPMHMAKARRDAGRLVGDGRPKAA